MFDDVTMSDVRRSRDDDYNYSLQSVSKTQLCYFPKFKLVQNFNMLPLIIKSLSDESHFRTELKTYFLSKYNIDCTIKDCLSCEPQTDSL